MSIDGTAELLTPFAAEEGPAAAQTADKVSAALSGVSDALRDALEGEAEAVREAERWKQEAQEWQRKYKEQTHLVQLLRSQSSLAAEGGIAGMNSIASLPSPLDRAPSEASSGGNIPHSASFTRRATLPVLPNVRVERPLTPTAALPPRDPSWALRALAPTATGSQQPPSHATLGSLASMLMACSMFQPGRRISVEEAGCGTPHSSAERSDSGEQGPPDVLADDFHARVSVEDDGASGVGAAAAAAVSVALARSWASAANQTQGALEQTANGTMRIGRAGFRLTAVRPRPSFRTQSGVSDPLSPHSNGTSPQNGALAAAARSRVRNESAPALLKLAEDYRAPAEQNRQPMRADGSGHGSAVNRPSTADNSGPPPAFADEQTNLGATLKLQWLSRPATVLVVAKPTAKVQAAMQKVVAWLLERRLSVILEPQVLARLGTQLAAAANVPPDKEGNTRGRQPQLLSWTPEQSLAEGIPPSHVPRSVADKLDLVLTLGGDGTVLWTGALLGTGPVPPLLSFALGSLGFMTPFSLGAMSSVLSSVLQGGFSLMLRHRLHCTIVRGSSHCNGDCASGEQPDEATPGSVPNEHEVLNELVMDRGMSPYLTSLDCYCDGNFVTNVQGDGLIVGTPTGSTAYNLAAGGSMVHPEVPGILFTPICPHSLASRPLIFPDHIHLRIQVPEDSRSDMWCSFDGKDRQRLCPGDAVVVRLSQWPMPMVTETNASHDWFTSMQQGLSWNSRQRQAGVEA